jgi:hypothetical protein
VEDLGAVARRALPKNLIRLLPVQDHKDSGSGFQRTIHAGAAHPRPSPRPATRLEEVERTPIFKYDYLHLHKQGGTKEFPYSPLAHMNGPLRFIRNF